MVQVKVLIVGCGLAGLSTALAIVSKDTDGQINVVIVEKRKNFESRGSTFGLALSGQIALQEIAPAVLRELKSVGKCMPETGGYMLPWWKVRDALLDEARSMPDRVTIHLGVSIDKLEENEGADAPLVATFQKSDLTIEADVVIGADGVHSYVRQHILLLPPARPTNTYVWRGSVDTNAVDDLKYVQDLEVGKIVTFGEAIMLFYFNFHPTVEGKAAWTFSCRPIDSSIDIEAGSTPLDLIQAYMDTVENPGEELLQDYQDAKLVFENTNHPSDLTWGTEMAVVDLTHESGWGGKGRITLVGDAAHSIRPVSGLGGSLAFEDAVLVSRAIIGDCSNRAIEKRIRDFEGERLPRCKSLSNDQTLRAVLAYKHGFTVVPQWDPKYRDWVFEGPDASPEPPVDEEDVLRGLIIKSK